MPRVAGLSNETPVSLARGRGFSLDAGRRLVADVDRAQDQVAEAVHDPAVAQAGVIEADARVDAEAAAVEVVAMEPATLAPGRGRGRRGGERNGAERGDGSGGENELADHGGLSCWAGCVMHPHSRQSRGGRGRFMRRSSATGPKPPLLCENVQTASQPVLGGLSLP